MKKIVKFRELLLVLLMLLLTGNVAYSQCNIVPTKTKACRGENIQFNLVPNTTSFASIKWAFGDGDSSTQNVTQVSHVYDTFGTFIATVTLYNIDGTIKCGPSQVAIKIFDRPNAGLILPDSTIMCFENNYFCFKDSSFTGKDKAPIVKYVWDYGDGDSSTLKDPCHSYGKDGKYTIFITVTDTNGCNDTASKVTSITVLPKLAPDFITQFVIGCPETPVSFLNKTDSNGKDITSYWWNFGDGSWDSTQNWGVPKFTHIYKRDGSFNPVLYVKSRHGCVDSIVKYSGAKNIFYWFDIKKSESGPVCWEGNNICFNQKPRPKAYYKLWTFDDPPSMLLNFNDEDWAPCHAYTAPGFYHVTLKIWEPNCIRDTTFCSYIPLKGPQAMIVLPPPPAFPPNNCLKGVPIPASVFHAAQSKCWNPTNKPIDYVTRAKGPKYTVSTTDTYCMNLIDSINIDTTLKPGCTDTTIIGIGYPMLGGPINSSSVYDSMYETLKQWTPGTPLPPEFYTGKAYYKKSGNCEYKTMHDSDIYVPNCQAPNWARFTNNSIKYRLYYAIDDNPLAYVGGPAGANPDVMFDMCRNKSYPWASDSMEYFWNFGDDQPGCTSTVQNPNMNCRFSTEIQPWHFFKSTGCWSVQLTVWDSVTQCASTATQLIYMEPPRASWDKSKYTYLDWSKQLRTPPALGQRGVILQGTPCVGQPYPQKPQFRETKPCGDGGQMWWMVFDSAQQCSSTCKDSTYLDLDNDGIKENKAVHNTITCGWIDKPTFMMMGNQWIYGDGGWKTIGLIIKSGDCFDTFFYPEYKYIYDLNIGFNINDPYQKDSFGRYVHLAYDTLEHQKLCAPFQAIMTVSDTDQVGITKFYFMIQKFFPPNAWESPAVNLLDSMRLTKKDTCFILCHKDSFTIDPFTNKKDYTYCFLYPDVTKGEKVDYSVLNTLFAQGFFKKDTLPQLRLVDTLFMKSDTAPRLTQLEPDYSMFVPGKYTVAAQLRNVYGCQNIAAAEVVVGHWATFEADDTIICYEGGGDTVTFTSMVRYYWVKDNPLDPDLNPNQYWVDPRDSFGGTLIVGGNPVWDLDPKFNPRTGPSASWPQPPYRDEEIWWDFDDGSGWHQQKNFTDTVRWIFNMPKDYKIRMKTIDSTGCEQILFKVVKVIGVVADFELDTTPGICAPQIVKFNDKSFGLNTWRYTYFPNGQVKDSSLVDKINYWYWTFGDPFSTTANKSYVQSPVHTYKRNGVFDIFLHVKNSNGCEDSILFPDYVTIMGPQPKFWLFENGDTTSMVEGCVTLTVTVLDSSDDVGVWQYVKGDNTTETFKSRPTDNKFTLTYSKPGTYYVNLVASDSFWNPAAGVWQTCTDRYADSQYHPEDPRYKVIVHGIPRTKFDGDTLICDGEVGTFKDLSDTGYTEMAWTISDGTTTFTMPAKTDMTHTFSLPTGTYDTTYKVEMDGLGNMCPDVLKSIKIRVVNTEAGLDVRSKKLPVFTFANLTKGGTNYKWIIKGIDNTTGNTSYYKEFETTDTNILVNDFMDTKGDFLVCIESKIMIPGLDGCPDSACIIVNNTFEVGIGKPNIFTPNGDGVNDVLNFKDNTKTADAPLGVKYWDLTIYNRWGEKVFQTEDSNEHWDGHNMNDGSECATGSYYYVLNYQLRGEEKKSFTNTVTLVR